VDARLTSKTRRLDARWTSKLNQARLDHLAAMIDSARSSDETRMQSASFSDEKENANANRRTANQIQKRFRRAATFPLCRQRVPQTFVYEKSKVVHARYINTPINRSLCESSFSVSALLAQVNTCIACTHYANTERLHGSKSISTACIMYHYASRESRQ